MIRKEELIEIGKFHKIHGLKGELNAIFDFDDLVEDYIADGNPLVVDVDGIYVPFYAESIRPKGSTSFLVKLDGLDSGEEAQGMVNKGVFALRDKITPEGEELLLQDELVGYAVVDSEFGEIGVIEEIDDSTANELILVKTPSGEIIYVPLVDDFIDSIDEEHRIMNVSIPESLLSLNSKE